MTPLVASVWSELSPPNILFFLASLGALAWLANQLLGLVDRIKEKPPPRETYVTKERFQDQERRIEDLSDAIQGLDRRLEVQIRELRQRIDQLPAQIITILKNTGALE